MATIELPMPTASNDTFRVSLDGQTYETLWLWNERDSHWILTLRDTEGTPVASGLRVVVGWDLLLNVKNLNAPQGALLFFDLSTSDETISGEDPGLSDLGDRVQGYYVEAADLA